MQAMSFLDMYTFKATGNTRIPLPLICTMQAVFADEGVALNTTKSVI